MTNHRTARKVKLQVWLTPEEHQLLSQAATETGQGMSSYVRSTVLNDIRTNLGLSLDSLKLSQGNSGTPKGYNPDSTVDKQEMTVY